MLVSTMYPMVLFSPMLVNSMPTPPKPSRVLTNPSALHHRFSPDNSVQTSSHESSGDISQYLNLDELASSAGMEQSRHGEMGESTQSIMWNLDSHDPFSHSHPHLFPASAYTSDLQHSVLGHQGSTQAHGESSAAQSATPAEDEELYQSRLLHPHSTKTGKVRSAAITELELAPAIAAQSTSMGTESTSFPPIEHITASLNTPTNGQMSPSSSDEYLDFTSLPISTKKQVFRILGERTDISHRAIQDYARRKIRTRTMLNEILSKDEGRIVSVIASMKMKRPAPWMDNLKKRERKQVVEKVAAVMNLSQWHNGYAILAKNDVTKEQGVELLHASQEKLQEVVLSWYKNKPKKRKGLNERNVS